MANTYLTNIAYMKNVQFALALFIAMMLTSCFPTGYKIVDGKVYYKEWTFSFGPREIMLEGADPKTFDDMKGGYAHDATHVWYRERLLDGADGSSFKYVKDGYAKDKQLVFLNGTLIYGAEASTFRVHSDSYAEDNHDFYWEGHPLYVADKNSFKLLGKATNYGTEWGKDRHYAYFLRSMGDEKGSVKPNRIRIADYDSFDNVPQKPEKKGDVLSGFYAKDKYQVYYRDTIVPGADPETFVEIAWEKGQDKNRKYKKGIAE